MTLKEKLEVQIMDLPIIDDIIDEIGTNLEYVADDFATGFTEWKDSHFSMYRDKTYYAITSSIYFDITKYIGKEKPTKYYTLLQLLEIYKKTL